jgi:pimeloyl-ACP methyl ester carboxylesterase
MASIDSGTAASTSAHAAEFAGRIPGAKSVVYAGLGHIPMEEAPERVISDLRAFLCAHRASVPTDDDTRHAPA